MNNRVNLNNSSIDTVCMKSFRSCTDTKATIMIVSQDITTSKMITYTTSAFASLSATGSGRSINLIASSNTKIP